MFEPEIPYILNRLTCWALVVIVTLKLLPPKSANTFAPKVCKDFQNVISPWNTKYGLSNEILYSYYLQSLQRLSTRVCKYFRPESLPGLSELDVITPEFRFESLYLSDFQSESLQRFWR